tara:strand:+ start:336 stop:527 length:192 start_codon:yes stop_codon:yes gene_type:complete
MAHEKFRMGSGSIGDRLHHPFLFSSPTWMAIKAGCEKRTNEMTHGCFTHHIHSGPYFLICFDQ